MDSTLGLEFIENFDIYDLNLGGLDAEIHTTTNFDSNKSPYSDIYMNQNYSITNYNQNFQNELQLNLNSIFESSNDSENLELYSCDVFSRKESASSNSNLSPSFDTSIIENYDFSKCESGPVKFVLKDTTIDDLKISTEIVLNFEPLENQKNTINENDLELLTVHSQKDSCIDLLDDDEINNTDLSDSEINKNEDTVLTEEEKNVYLKEGYKIPNKTPLTKSEEKILKLVRRKIRNKKSAHISRERKKKYVDGLEKRVDLCTKENDQLQSEVKSLKSKNLELMKELQKMQALITSLVTKNKKSSTAVLFVSFLITFCIFPNMSIEEDINSYDLTYQAINSVSRQLLSSNPPKNQIEINTTDQYDYIWDIYKSRYDI
ncbi:unnamed protein product [Brachionus calyciflorus]|uniref:BZIP domain-containing protein n=1 Tax=Brachionus calyciflorus TaxID=104777 RepID=A0A814D863_9BILA|nr:unnamed protein product [Brachionus calyciflorus]